MSKLLNGPEKDKQYLKERKDFINEIRCLERELEPRAKQRGETIGEIQYYRTFNLLPENAKHIGLKEDNIFVVEKYTKKDDHFIHQDEIYDKDHKKIAQTDEHGKLTYMLSYKEELKERLQGFYEQVGLEERSLFLHKDGPNLDDDAGLDSYAVADELSKERLNSGNVTEREMEKLKEEKEENEKGRGASNSKEKMEQDLGLERGDIQYAAIVKDKLFYEKVLAAKNYDERVQFVMKKGSKYPMVVGKRDGNYEKLDCLEDARDTLETTRCLGRDGKTIEQENIYGLMKVKGNEKIAYAFTYGTHGVPEMHELRWNRVDGEYSFGAKVETRINYPRGKELEKMMDPTRNVYLNEETDKYEIAQKHGLKPNLDMIKDENDTLTEKETYEKTPWENREEERMRYNKY